MVTDMATVMLDEIHAVEVSTGKVSLKVGGSCRHGIDSAGGIGSHARSWTACPMDWR
jgi:hypothetical protein